MRPRLRLFTGEETAVCSEPNVTVRLSEISQVLADAVNWDRTWLNDFADDEIQISSDLYEILSACRHLRPSA